MSQFASSLPSTVTSPAVDNTERNGRFLGLAIAALLPALFWTVVLYLAAGAAGFEIGPTALFSFMASVAGFLAAVVSALQQRI